MAMRRQSGTTSRCGCVMSARDKPRREASADTPAALSNAAVVAAVTSMIDKSHAVAVTLPSSECRSRAHSRTSRTEL